MTYNWSKTRLDGTTTMGARDHAGSGLGGTPDGLARCAQQSASLGGYSLDIEKTAASHLTTSLALVNKGRVTPALSNRRYRIGLAGLQRWRLLLPRLFLDKTIRHRSVGDVGDHLALLTRDDTPKCPYTPGNVGCTPGNVDSQVVYHRPFLKRPPLFVQTIKFEFDIAVRLYNRDLDPRDECCNRMRWENCAY